MAERRKQGLCFNCDEQYVRGHRCPRLFYIEVDDDDDEIALEDTHCHQEPAHTVSLHALTGLWGIRTTETMQIKVTMGTKAFTALLDTGSTHNFISEDLVPHMGVQLEARPGLRVVVANGDKVSSGGIARQIQFQIAGEPFTMDALAIPLEGFDIVLGVQWLRSLGPILWDFNNLCISFWRAGRHISWEGVVAPIATVRAITGSKEDLLTDLLSEFEDRFAEPTGLPSACSFNQMALRDTPFKIVNGRSPPSLQTYDDETAKVAAVPAQKNIYIFKG